MTIESLFERINVLEKKRNIIIYGLIEEAGENQARLEMRVMDIFSRELDLDVHPYEVDFVRRYYTSSNHPQARPILLGLTTFKRKTQILQRFQQCKSPSVNITADYTRNILEKKMTSPRW